MSLAHHGVNYANNLTAMFRHTAYGNYPKLILESAGFFMFISGGLGVWRVAITHVNMIYNKGRFLVACETFENLWTYI